MSKKETAYQGPKQTIDLRACCACLQTPIIPINTIFTMITIVSILIHGVMASSGVVGVFYVGISLICLFKLEGAHSLVST